MVPFLVLTIIQTGEGGLVGRGRVIYGLCCVNKWRNIDQKWFNGIWENYYGNIFGYKLITKTLPFVYLSLTISLNMLRCVNLLALYIFSYLHTIPSTKLYETGDGWECPPPLHVIGEGWGCSPPFTCYWWGRGCSPPLHVIALPSHVWRQFRYLLRKDLQERGPMPSVISHI